MTRYNQHRIQRLNKSLSALGRWVVLPTLAILVIG